MAEFFAQSGCDVDDARRHVPQGDATAFTGESAGTGEPDAAGAAGYYRYMTTQFELHLPIPSLTKVEEGHHQAA